jgi:hypothetical protein
VRVNGLRYRVVARATYSAAIRGAIHRGNQREHGIHNVLSPMLRKRRSLISYGSFQLWLILTRIVGRDI